MKNRVGLKKLAIPMVCALQSVLMGSVDPAIHSKRLYLEYKQAVIHELNSLAESSNPQQYLSQLHLMVDDWYRQFNLAEPAFFKARVFLEEIKYQTGMRRIDGINKARQWIQVSLNHNPHYYRPYIMLAILHRRICEKGSFVKWYLQRHMTKIQLTPESLLDLNTITEENSQRLLQKSLQLRPSPRAYYELGKYKQALEVPSIDALDSDIIQAMKKMVLKGVK